MRRGEILSKKPHSSAEALFKAGLFLIMSSISWLSINNFYIARIDGFDPFRYEYYALNGLPQYLQETATYRIVYILQFIYQYLPEYVGYIIFIGLCLFIVVESDVGGRLKCAIISPISFFYIAQTGKDGLSILAFASIGVIAMRRMSFSLIPLVAIISLGIFVRPAILLFLPLIYASFKYKANKVYLLSIILVIFFIASGIGYETLSTVEGAASDEGSGMAAQYGREFTFGYTATAIVWRAVLLIASTFGQPFFSAVKIYNGGEYFIILEGLCQFMFLLSLYRLRIMREFVISSLPFVIIVAASSPFYHFRYMAILYPIILASAIGRRATASAPNHDVQDFHL